MASLDVAAEKPAEGVIRNADIAAFLNSGALAWHVRQVAQRALDRLRNSGEAKMLDPEADNPAIMYRDGQSLHTDSSGQGRELFLRTGNAPTSFHAVPDDLYFVVAVNPIEIEKFDIVGLVDDDYYMPHKDMRLVSKGMFSVSPGEAIFRSKKSEFYDIKASGLSKYIMYYPQRGKAAHRLVFDKQNLLLVATGGLDVSTSKSISHLEILEKFNSPFLEEIALGSIDHYSPVVRWRALSSLNKIGYEKTVDLLKRFANDEAAYLSKMAKSILQSQGL
jgi:hypothetical protein